MENEELLQLNKKINALTDDLEELKYSVSKKLGSGSKDIQATIAKLYSNTANGFTLDYGSNILLKEGGSIKFTSVPAPTACTATLITAAGNVDAGTHKYKITYVNATGETKLGAVSNTVTVDATHKQVALSVIPLSSSGSVISRKIYRTKAGGTTYFLLTTINNNTTTTYTDNTADADLGIQGDYRQNTTYGKIIINDIVCIDIGTYNIAIGVNSLKNTYGLGNNAIGYEALKANTTGNNNVAVGLQSLHDNTIGGGNVAIGEQTIHLNTSGDYNTAVGLESLMYNGTGSNNTAIGAFTLMDNETGSYNTAIGFYAMENVGVSGSYNIAIGNYAGRNETGSYKLFIDSLDRTDESGGQTKSLIYGVFAAATANQRLTINAILKNSVQAGITAFATGGQASAVAITANIAEISVCATAQDSVKLPSAETGMKIIITNHGAASCDVFPNTDDAINEGAANAAKALAANASLMCVAYDTTNWECLTMAR